MDVSVAYTANANRYKPSYHVSDTRTLTASLVQISGAPERGLEKRGSGFYIWHLSDGS